MIDQNLKVTEVEPRITAALFASTLKAAYSPAAGEAEASYAAIVAEGVDPAFVLAIFYAESRFATDPDSINVKYGNKNPGNCRSSRIGVKATVTDPKRGTFVKYKTWADGFRDTAKRLVDPAFDYVKAAAQTVAQIVQIFAPPKDNNNTPVYLNTVVSFLNSVVQNVEATKMKVALAAGHHNTDGGSPVEAAITGELCEAYARAFKAAGVDVRVITPDGPDPDSEPGDGMFPGGLDAVAQKVVTWSEQGWTADLFLECHTQGVGDSSVRGVFAIYPEWGSDLDSTVKGALGKKIAEAIHFASGIPVWGNGLMSEKATGVGISGYRLGIFRVTSAVAAKTTRLIVEHGAHSNPQDLYILRTPGMLDKIASAAVKAITDFFGVTKDVNNDVIFVPETGKAVGFGFKKFWEGLDAAGTNMRLKLMGYPITNEFDMSFEGQPDSKKTVQLFERGGLVHENDQPQDWQNHTLKVPELIQAYQYAAENKLI